MAKRIVRTQTVDARSGEILDESRKTLFISEQYITGEGYRLYSRKRTRLGRWDVPLSLKSEGLLYIIIRTMDEQNRMIPVSELFGRVDIRRRNGYQLLAELKDAGAIVKAGSGYAVNPVIAFAGTYLPPWLYKLFEKDLKREIPLRYQALYRQEET